MECEVLCQMLGVLPALKGRYMTGTVDVAFFFSPIDRELTQLKLRMVC